MANYTLTRVREFHNKFGHPVADHINVPSRQQRLLRFKLLFEEVLEFGRAVGVKGLADTTQESFEQDMREALDQFTIEPTAEVDMVEAADALADIDYVMCGAFLVFGMPQEALGEEVHRSNMSKLGEDGMPVYGADGKVKKGPNYTPPNIAAVLREFGLQL